VVIEGPACDSGGNDDLLAADGVVTTRSEQVAAGGDQRRAGSGPSFRLSPSGQAICSAI
jgi:hypothetical protein